MPIAGLKDEGAGLRFGPYLTVRKLGDGGMGSVYLAIRVDAEFEKHVAIKCVRSRMASQRVVDRFRHERQILARLEHPNIARLFDGGTTDEGFPYLVMEYVSGQVITDYCDALRLKIRDRLSIFRKVLAVRCFRWPVWLGHWSRFPWFG